MKMIVVTTITSVLDVDSMKAEHSVEIEDKDGLSEVHSDVLGTLVAGGLRASLNSVYDQFPRARAAAERADSKED